MLAPSSGDVLHELNLAASIVQTASFGGLFLFSVMFGIAKIQTLCLAWPTLDY